MAGVNKAIILGRLGRDPEVRNFNNGGRVVNLRIATSETWKDREGERQERTEWHNVAIFNEKLGEIAEKYLRKGSEVYIEGQIETRKYQDQSGQDRYSTEIVLRPYRGEIALIGGRQDGNGDDRDSGRSGSRDDRDDRGRDSRRDDRSGRSSDRGSRDDRGGRQASGRGSGGWDDDRGGRSNSRSAPPSDLDDDIPF